ncbi:MAG: FixH family protein [Elstera sp.]|jgi:nitrogen fixation protein FixH
MTSLRMMTQTEASHRYRWIPWCFLAGFGVVLIANGTLLYFATRQPVGLVIEKPYENGIAYNKILAAGRVQAKLGWGAQILASDFNAVEGRARFQLLVTDANGPLDAVVVQLTLTRPLEGNSLPTVSLPVEAGRAQVTLNGLRPGQWAARMVIRQGEAQAVIEQRMILK